MSKIRNKTRKQATSLPGERAFQTEAAGTGVMRQERKSVGLRGQTSKRLRQSSGNEVRQA